MLKLIKLTKRSVDALEPGDEVKTTWDREIKGFGVRVTLSGRKTYVVSYRPKPGGGNAPRRWYTIGTHGSQRSVDKARTEAKRILGLVADGKDPQAEHMAERRREGKTVAELVPSYIKSKKRQRSVNEVERVLLKDLVPALGSQRPEDVTRRNIADLIAKVELRGTVMAGRTLAHVRHFFRWCLERGFIEANPCFGIKSPEKPTSRERVLSDEELVEVWKAAEAVGRPWESFVKLLILTAQRRNEVADMRWNEIKGNTWVIPAERTKNKREHKVPLSKTALAVIEAQPKQEKGKGRKIVPCPYVFSTNASTPISGFSRAKKQIDQKISDTREEAAKEAKTKPEKVEPLPHWTYHDLRRTAVTGMAKLGIQPQVADAVLNHKSGTISGVAAVYQRYRYGDEARRALEAWDGFVAAIVKGEAPPSNVVPLVG